MKNVKISNNCILIISYLLLSALIVFQACIFRAKVDPQCKFENKISNHYSNIIYTMIDDNPIEIPIEDKYIPKYDKTITLYHSILIKYPGLEDNEDMLFIIDTAIKYSIENNLQSNLVLAVIFTESSFKPLAANSCCDGLMQINRKFHHLDNPFDIEENISYGTLLLKNYIDKYGYEGGLSKYSGGAKNYASKVNNRRKYFVCK